MTTNTKMQLADCSSSSGPAKLTVADESPTLGLVRTFAATSLVFLGGLAIMVLEIIGARYLEKDFGSSFYVWVSQIGVILVALALGYVVGGALADRWQRLAFLSMLLMPTGVAIAMIP